MHERVSDQEGYFLSPFDFLRDFLLIFVLRAAFFRFVLFRFFIASPHAPIVFTMGLTMLSKTYYGLIYNACKGSLL